MDVPVTTNQFNSSPFFTMSVSNHRSEKEWAFNQWDVLLVKIDGPVFESHLSS